MTQVDAKLCENSAPRVVTVTASELAVVDELVLDGAGNATIAHRLSVTEDTIKSHVKRVLQAVGATSRTHLVCLLLRGLVQVRVEDGRAKK